MHAKSIRNYCGIVVGFLLLFSGVLFANTVPPAADTSVVDRDYVLESSMLGYFRKDGTRNPVLKANKGDRVRITIVNAELMPHDIALELLGVQSAVVVEKGDKASITFTAMESDRYYCTIPGHRVAGMEGELVIVEGEIGGEELIAGEVPVKDGRRLNLNFETGDLTDWTAEGDAFQDPLLSEDPSPLHEKEMTIGKGGNYFLSSGGTVRYKQTGTLTSVPFVVTHPYATFRVSGGALQDTRVEILDAAAGEVIFSVTGSGRSILQPVVVDLQSFQGKEIQVRIIDHETGISSIPYIRDDIRAHINFDDFLFHPERPAYENELKPGDIIALPPVDPIRFSGLSGEEAARSMTVPEGFKITLAAAEPDVVRPISFTIDARNRLWVAEGHTYPVKAPEGAGKDRILIFEDTDGDCTLDKRTVFMEGLNLVSGIEIGRGGLWVGAAPELLYIPVDFENDKPAGPAQIVLDGWGLDDTHETLNNLRWGPDGWLYGVHGVFTHSLVGKPGDPEEKRTRLNAGVWRYHPASRKFEVFAEGSSNPWGIDFNAHGHAFITVCVIPHLYHVIQGARYQRQAGKHFNPYVYDDIKTIADHVHWVGDRGPHAGNFRSASKGGGHAHAGAMIYLGNSWPAEYHNEIFMNNINGARLNRDHLERKGTGYTGSHRPDFLEMNDTWSQWLNLRYDANGSVYAIDWYDKNQCHSPNPEVHDKTLGRIFRISYKEDQWRPVNLYQASVKELIAYQLHENEWFARQSRLLLQDRKLSGKDIKSLKRILEKNPDVTHKLRALWTLHVTGGLKERELQALLRHPEELVRSWAIQLAMETYGEQITVRNALKKQAAGEESPLVRLYLASAMQQFPVNERWEMLEHLLQVEADAGDHNQPLMLWYAMEATVPLDPERAVALALKAKPAIILPYTIRRIGAIGDEASKRVLSSLQQTLEKTTDHRYHHSLELLKGEL